MRRVLLALLPLLLVGWIAAPARATTIDDVVSALQSDPVYNDPKAENALTDAQAADLSEQITTGGEPIHIAILPAAARGSRSTEDVVGYLQQNVGEPGTYAAVVGNQFRSTAPAAADAAFEQQQGNGVYAVLSQFVDNVATMGDAAAAPSTPDESPSSGSSLVPLLVIGTLAAGIGGLVFRSSRRRKQANAEALATVRQALDEDITAFGESLDSVDSAAISTDENRADWMAALDQYERAKRSAGTMRTPAEAATVTEALDEGRFRVACVQARLAGEPLPERRPPCFFDPRHGPSLEDVAYTPTGTTQQRDVPACAACSAAIADGLDPQVRMVPATGGGRQPYWQAGPQYGGYANGYYGSSGMDLFSTILVGTMLGNMMTAGMHGGYPVGDSGWSGETGGGNFGGGDFGGGDFGGGDFGGGDFGGGDFGGW